MTLLTRVRNLTLQHLSSTSLKGFLCSRISSSSRELITVERHLKTSSLLSCPTLLEVNKTKDFSLERVTRLSSTPKVAPSASIVLLKTMTRSVKLRRYCRLFSTCSNMEAQQRQASWQETQMMCIACATSKASR